MLSIVAHHYVVNSGLTLIDGPIANDLLSIKSIYLLIIGAWGKSGINCFVMITGWFMCKSNITIKKYLKILCQIFFYRIAIQGVFLITGYTTFFEAIKVLLPVRDISSDFMSAYILFFLFIPFLNNAINNMSEIQHLRLIVLLMGIYVVLGTLPGMVVTMNYVSWFLVLYFVASYLRIYPHNFSENKRFWGIAAIVSLVLSVISVIGVAIFRDVFNIPGAGCYYFLSDCNKILAFTNGITWFMYFINLNIGFHPWINKIAASTFGVFLIHTCGNDMRQWLWKDLFNNVGSYDSVYVFIHPIVCVLTVYIICTIIDFLRIKYVEKPFLTWADDKLEKVKVMYIEHESEILTKYNIHK